MDENTKLWYSSTLSLYEALEKETTEQKKVQKMCIRDSQYTLTKNRRNDILTDINKKLVEYSSNGGNKEHIEVITDEVTRIKNKDRQEKK